MKLSICIPTYNRANHLSNCLNSILIAISNCPDFEVEVCISDNCSKDNTREIVKTFLSILPISYHQNNENLGIPKNFLNVVSMAKGEFAWLVGDDDLLTPNSLQIIKDLLNKNESVEFFYVNAYHLSADFVEKFPRPFNTKNLPDHMEKFSKYRKEGQLPFLNLIDPDKSFDFLGGMFLSVFKKKLWDQNTKQITQKALDDPRTFSYFDNTFPHVKIFSHAFTNSTAYFNTTPALVCLEGAREWAPMSPLIRSVRLIEALAEYRRNGLGLIQYLKCRNFALQYFIQDIILMVIHGKKSGRHYVSLTQLIFSNLPYPNTYLSIFYTITRKVKHILEN